MEWSQKNKSRIREQLQSMGSLLNWKEEVLLLLISLTLLVLYFGSKETSGCKESIYRFVQER